MNFLSNLPSFDKSAFSSTAPSSKPERPAVYTATHDKTLPPSDQVISTEKTHILLRYIYSSEAKKQTHGPDTAYPVSSSTTQSHTAPPPTSTTASQAGPGLSSTQSLLSASSLSTAVASSAAAAPTRPPLRQNKRAADSEYPDSKQPRVDDSHSNRNDNDDNDNDDDDGGAGSATTLRSSTMQL